MSKFYTTTVFGRKKIIEIKDGAYRFLFEKQWTKPHNLDHVIEQCEEIQPESGCGQIFGSAKSASVLDAAKDLGIKVIDIPVFRSDDPIDMQCNAWGAGITP